MSDARKEFWIDQTPNDKNFEMFHYYHAYTVKGVSCLHVVHASWRDQAEKMALALREVAMESQGSELICSEAIAEFEAFKKGGGK